MSKRQRLNEAAGLSKAKPFLPGRQVPTPIGDGRWPQWRGPNRLANQAVLPETLSETPEILWEKKLEGDGISGVVSDGSIVVVADRDVLDTSDIFRCLDFATGAERWQLKYSAPSNFDYGNAPRATPLLAGDRVFTLGASGQLHAVSLSSGKILWQTSLPSAFGGPIPQWGFAGSPLLIDAVYEGDALKSGKLIVQPGAADAGLAALDALTGEVIWKSSPGRPAAYASPQLASFAGVRQIIAYDAKSLGGWDPETGERLWELVPSRSGDFNVPTPIPLDERHLFVATENNKGRIYRFDDKGRIDPKPVFVQDELAHDSNTAVASEGRIYAADWALLCLDAGSLRILWTLEDDALGDYATLILGETRLLLSTHDGTVLLIDRTVEPGRIVSRWRPFGDDDVVLSHPVVLTNRLLVRSTSKIVCIRLDAGE